MEAGLAGLISGAGLIVGAVAALTLPLTHGLIARVMAAGAGIILAAASLDLAVTATREAGATGAGLSLVVGALAFSLMNFVISRKGAEKRKRCGACVAQPTEAEQPGSGVAIAAGTLLDGVPEAAVLGISIGMGAMASVPLVVAFFIGNVPEALSSAAGMRQAGRSRRYILGLWTTSWLAIGAIAALSAVLLAETSPNHSGWLSGFAAGALIALAGETMLPEASHGSPPFVGVTAAAGFALIGLLIAAG